VFVLQTKCSTNVNNWNKKKDMDKNLLVKTWLSVEQIRTTSGLKYFFRVREVLYAKLVMNITVH
jgi:hypothetical protein